MATVIHIKTFQIRTSVNTPDYTRSDKIHYDDGNWRELYKLPELPTCDKKYWKWTGEAVVEMTTEEKAFEDYVKPTPEPTPEELAVKTTNERRHNIQTDIRVIYPELSDEIKEIRMVLAEEFPDNIRAQKYNIDIETILTKYPKV